MRKVLLTLLLGLAATMLVAAEVEAACPSPLSVTTTSGVNTNFSVGADASGNCSTNITDNATVGGNAKPLQTCNSVATYNASTSGATQIVPINGSTKIYVCGYTFFVGTVATNVGLVYGTGTNCAGGLSATGMPGSGGSSFTGFPIPAGGAIVDRSPFWNGIVTPAGQALCIDDNAANQVVGVVYYDQY